MSLIVIEGEKRSLYWAETFLDNSLSAFSDRFSEEEVMGERWINKIVWTVITTTEQM